MFIKKKAFTLIELLVVIAIIALLVLIAIIAFARARQESRDASRLSDLKQIQTALELFNIDKDYYPPGDGTGTPVLLGDPNHKCLGATGFADTTTCVEPYYMEKVPSGPTGGENLGKNYYYYAATNSPQIYLVTTTLEGMLGYLTNNSPIQLTPWSGITQTPYGSSSTTIAVTGVSFLLVTTTLYTDQSFLFVAEVSPANATNQNLVWSVIGGAENGTIDNTGLYTAPPSPSIATIRVTTADGGYTDTYPVTINEFQPVTGIWLTPASSTILQGGTQQLTATISPFNATNQTVNWSMFSGPGSVSATGMYDGSTVGTAVVRATTQDGNFSAYATTTVTAPIISVTGVTLAPISTTITVTHTQQFVATIAPANATNQDVNWSVVGGSSNGTINSSGLYTAPITAPVSPVTVSVTTVDGGEVDTSSVTIFNNISYININAISVAPDGTTQATGTFTTGNATDVIWSTTADSASSPGTEGGNSTYGTIDTSGNYTAPAGASGANFAKVWAVSRSNGNVLTWAPVNIYIAVTSVSVSPSSASIPQNTTQQLTATVLPANATNPAVTWAMVSGPGSVSTSGLYTGSSMGTAVVKATSQDDSNKTSNSTITVSLPLCNGSIACGSLCSYGQDYATVQIGTQCWFAQNLNVGTMLASAATMPTLGNGAIEKWCYGSSDAICNTDGGLYTWAEANQLAAGCDTGSCTPPADNQGICPSGWHIPTDVEFKTLEMYLGMSQAEADATGQRGTHSEGTQLKTGGTSGFSALLSGSRLTIGSFFGRVTTGGWWLASEDSADNGWTRGVYSGSNSTVNRNSYYKTNGSSIRCVQN